MPENTADLLQYLHFFRKELTENLLPFWLPRCLDHQNGGYLNCFTNDGSKRISTDKYTWSQGRFLWLFSRLSMLESNLYDRTQREEFLSYAKSGKDFLLRHALVAPEDYRCVFLTDAKGQPKPVAGHQGFDLSISADCFVAMGFAAYARAAGDREAWLFAQKLGDSVWCRYQSGNFRSLPYPVPPGYRSHAKPMILTNLCCELFRAAEVFSPDYTTHLRDRLRLCQNEVFSVFLDKQNLIHEFTCTNGCFAQNLFGQHINPGHTLEDLWFQLEAGDILQARQYEGMISEIAVQTMALGWDREYGGLFHFIPCDGVDTAYTPGDTANEPQMRLVLDDWDSKLWWVHSEAMYTTLLLYCRTGEDRFLRLFDQVFTYTYNTFPNPDREIREWIQIRRRDGSPQDKVVALPVKDPYHIARNVLLIIELLEKRRDKI